VVKFGQCLRGENGDATDHEWPVAIGEGVSSKQKRDDVRVHYNSPRERRDLRRKGAQLRLPLVARIPFRLTAQLLEEGAEFLKVLGITRLRWRPYRVLKSEGPVGTEDLGELLIGRRKPSWLFGIRHLFLRNRNPGFLCLTLLSQPPTPGAEGALALGGAGIDTGSAHRHFLYRYAYCVTI
jgi:hypothetical protein